MARLLDSLPGYPQTSDCPICLSQGSVRRLFEKKVAHESYEIVRCAQCSVEFVYPVPGPAVVHGAQRQAFTGHASNGPESRLSETVWATERDVISALGFHSGHILDIGCGTGDFLARLPDTWDKTGVELVGPRADIARRKGLRILNQPVEDCQFGAGQFDVVTMYALIEHVRDPAALLAVATAALRPGGLLVVMTGARNSLKAKLKGAYWHMYCPPTHLWFFTHESLSVLLKHLGLVEILSRYTSGTMPWCTGNSWTAKAADCLERHLVKSVFDRPPFWRVPFYDHLYLYATKEGEGISRYAMGWLHGSR